MKTVIGFLDWESINNKVNNFKQSFLKSYNNYNDIKISKLFNDYIP